MTAAEALVEGARIWGMIGAAVALLFLTIGMDRIDPDTRGAYAFRPLLVPAILLIWPLVLWRWWVLETGRDRWQNRYAPPRQAHLVVACVLAACIALASLAGWSVRQVWPAGIAPERLSPPAESKE